MQGERGSATEGPLPGAGRCRRGNFGARNQQVPITFPISSCREEARPLLGFGKPRPRCQLPAAVPFSGSFHPELWARVGPSPGDKNKSKNVPFGAVPAVGLFLECHAQGARTHRWTSHRSAPRCPWCPVLPLLPGSMHDLKII